MLLALELLAELSPRLEITNRQRRGPSESPANVRSKLWIMRWVADSGLEANWTRDLYSSIQTCNVSGKTLMIVSSCRQLHQAHQPLTAVAGSYRPPNLIHPAGILPPSYFCWLKKYVLALSLRHCRLSIWLDDVRIYVPRDEKRVTTKAMRNSLCIHRQFTC